MFLRFEPRTGMHEAIIDSVFEESVYVGGWGRYIEVYERRRLPVVQNLLRMFAYHVKHFTHSPGADIAWMVRINIRDPKVAQYKDELEKYLVLL